ncbi:MAG: hypothetical protein H0V82_07855 [Candidatus Protochlamydia sp.]|nr:hypothetical protein [Candidatus Protochlamydia sp.]
MIKKALLSQELLNLLSLTQIYIHREYDLKASFSTSLNQHTFFKDQIIQKIPLKDQAELFVSSIEKGKNQPSPPNSLISFPQPHALPPAPRYEPLHPELIQIETAPPAEETLKPIQSKNFINLEPLQETAFKGGESDFRELFYKFFPHFPLTESIPDDTLAKKKMFAWSKELEIPPVLLLSFSEDERQFTFLKNIARAITLHFTPARALSAKKIEWNNLLKNSALRLIIISDHELYSQPSLMAHYQEIPQQGKHFLQKTPLLLLSDLNLYLKETQLKPLLWRAICKELA